MSNKYVVFKAEDWDGFTEYLRQDGFYSKVRTGNGVIHPVDDAVVIRRQDIFASLALWGYAHAVRTTLDMGNKLDGGWQDSVEYHDLLELADYFTEQAMLSEDGTKVPD